MAKKEYEVRLEVHVEQQRIQAESAMEAHKAALQQVQADADRRFEALKVAVDAEVKLMIASMGAQVKMASGQQKIEGDAEAAEKQAEQVEPKDDSSDQMVGALSEAITGFKLAIEDMNKIARADRELIRDPLTGKAKGMKVMLQ